MSFYVLRVPGTRAGHQDVRQQGHTPMAGNCCTYYKLLPTVTSFFLTLYFLSMKNTSILIQQISISFMAF